MVKHESLLPAFGVLAFQVRNVLHGPAEAGGTDHGAVCTGEAARRNVVPPGMLAIAVTQVFDFGRVHGATICRVVLATTSAAVCSDSCAVTTGSP